MCLVTDRRRLVPSARTEAEELSALEALIDQAMSEGVGAVQIREPDVTPRALVGLVRRVMARRGVAVTRVLVNDRADVARAGDADGVHLRANSPAAVRIRLLHEAWILGRSVHAADSTGVEEDLDYTLFGTVFRSASKPAGHVPGGLQRLAAVVRASKAPVLAIGGITTAAQATACVRAGAFGVAAIGIFLPEGAAPGAIGVRRAVRELTAAIEVDAEGAREAR